MLIPIVALRLNPETEVDCVERAVGPGIPIVDAGEAGGDICVSCVAVGVKLIFGREATIEA